MGKYDDFNLDLNKVKAGSENQPNGTILISVTLALKCQTVDNCPSTQCSPSDRTECRNVENEPILRC